MDVVEQAAAWRAEGRGVALATVVATWGSSPRPAGSQLAVEQGGAFVGSVSGGCIEGAVVQAALEVISSGLPRLLDFGVSNERAWEVGLACGGKVSVFVERGDGAIEALLAARAEGRPLVLATDLGTGARARRDDDAARAAIRKDESQVVDGVFLHVVGPPARLIIVGAVHVAQSLARQAALLDMKVVVVDPRRAFATAERFPGEELVTQWPDAALAGLALDERTAVITLTHDPKLDEPALAAALRSRAFYIGALGSKRTHAARLGRLREAGFTDEELARIHGPVGLDIGARSAPEIALSILAQVVAKLRA